MNIEKLAKLYIEANKDHAGDYFLEGLREGLAMENTNWRWQHLRHNIKETAYSMKDPDHKPSPFYTEKASFKEIPVKIILYEYERNSTYEGWKYSNLTTGYKPIVGNKRMSYFSGADYCSIPASGWFDINLRYFNPSDERMHQTAAYNPFDIEKAWDYEEDEIVDWPYNYDGEW